MQDELINEQIAREKRAAALSQSRKLKALAEAVEAGQLDAIPAAGRVVARLFEGMVAALEIVVARTEKGPGAAQRGWLRELSPDVLAVITIRQVMSTCLANRDKGATIQQLGVGLGRRIVREVLVQKADLVNPVYVERTHEYLRGAGTVSQHHIDRTMDRVILHVLELDAQETMRDADLLHMGKHCVQAALGVGLLEIRRGVNHKGKTVVYVLPPEIEELLTSYLPALLHTPSVLSVAPPVKWISAFGGGYHTKELSRPLVRLGWTSRPTTRRYVLSELGSCERVLNVVNYLQSIPFELESKASNTLSRVWQGGGAVLGIPHRSPMPKPAFPFAPDWNKVGASEAELEEFRSWKRRMASWYTDDKKRIGSLYEVADILRCVREVRGRTVWFPVFLDFRQRIYYGGNPNPQGADPARSVIHFKQKKPLGHRGIFWLKVHIANCFGQDKGRFEARAAWTDQNWEALSEGAHAPEDSDLYRGLAEAPFVACSAVQELQAAFASGDPASYCTGIPIHMDATCSGLQHFSAMLRDPVGGKYVNLLDSGGEVKADIYGRVAEVAMQKVQRIASDSTHKWCAAARLWLEVGLPRSLAKKPVMTYVYGATLRSVADHCCMFLEEHSWRNEHVTTHSMGRFMAQTLFDSIEDVVPAAAECMRWLRKRCRENGRDSAMIWRNPVGFPVSLDIREHNERTVRIRSCGIQQVVLKELGELNNGARIGNSVSPNFVHALDAAHLSMTAEKMQALGLEMIAIHDSFGTHPADVDAMHRCIREAFVEMYTENDPLADFLEGLGQDAELPMRGNLDINQVLTSEFFFC